MRYESGQTAVIVPVPAAEPAVTRWRTRFDTSAGFGVPAHVTVLYPFLPSDVLTTGDLDDLTRIFAAAPAFDVAFATMSTFPGVVERSADAPGVPAVLYLEPDPADPFRQLTGAVAARWPQAPPYGGRYPDPIPHLTVTDTAQDAEVAAARRSLASRLPITTHIDRGCVLVFDGARWLERCTLPLR